MLVIIDVKPKDLGLPTEGYISVEEVHDVSLLVGLTWIPPGAVPHAWRAGVVFPLGGRWGSTLLVGFWSLCRHLVPGF